MTRLIAVIRTLARRRSRRALLRVLRALWPVYRAAPAERGPRLRAAILELGGLWVKVGQLLSLRYDLLPRDICEALTVFQGTLPGVVGTYARDEVLAELQTRGVTFDEAFSAFTDAPMAVASIGQVHRATLVDGTEVAVKVVSPDAEARYAEDFVAVQAIGTLIGLVTRRVRVDDFVAELQAVITEELDLRFEAHHLQVMRKKLRKHDKLTAPRVFAICSGRRVLTTEWIDGTVMGDILALPAVEQVAWFADRQLDPLRQAKRLMASLLRQVFEQNRFHGDLHPRNIIVTGRRLALIDFGTTSATEGDFLAHFRAYARALSRRDYSRAADLYCLLCIWPPRPGLFRVYDWLVGSDRHPALRRRLVRVLQAWAARTEVPSLPFAEKSINRLSQDLMIEVLGAGGTMQWGWLRLMRAFASVEGTVGVLHPEIDYVRVMRDYLLTAEQRERLDPINPVGVVNQLNRLTDWADERTRLENATARLEALGKEI